MVNVVEGAVLPTRRVNVECCEGSPVTHNKGECWRESRVTHNKGEW